MIGGAFMEKNVIKALNDQINFEQYSGFIYLALALRMDELNFKGYSKWLRSHYEEELHHANAFIDFMQKRDGKVELSDIKMEQMDVNSPLEAAKIILAHEEKVTARIYNIHDIAKKELDYATEIFMHQFIEEQIEEEATARDIVDSFVLASDAISAQVVIDRELGSRVTR